MEKIKNIIIRYLLGFLSNFMRLTIIVLGGLKLFSEPKELIFAFSFFTVLTIYFLNTNLKAVVRKIGHDGIIRYSQVNSLIMTIVFSTLLSAFMGVLLTHCAISIIFDLRSISELTNFLDNSNNNQIRIWFLVFFMTFEFTNVLSTIWLIDKEKIIVTKNEELSNAHATQLRIINSIQHELGNKLPIVHLGFQDLKDVIFKLNTKGEIDINKPIRDPIGNETIESIDTIRKLLSNIDTGMMNSIIVIENMKSIIRTDSESLQMTDTDINEFIRSDLEQRMSQFNNVKFHSTNASGQGFRLKIDQKQMKILLDNIYSNAQAHSFVDEEIQYDFWISLFNRKKEVEIVFQTNGNPFPNDISVEKYTEFNYFSGPNGHSGIGGYLIGQVVQNHKGKISLKPRNELRPSETSITITLPKQEK